MAKRKGARAKRRQTADKRAATSRQAARKGAARKSARKRAGATARKATGRKAARSASARKTTRKATVRKATVRKATTRKTAARKAAAKPAARRVAPRKAPKNVSARKMPALDRARRTMLEEDMARTPPSSLDLDRTASSARTGRRELREKFNEHTETSPALTGGDIDADWESAHSVGDEAPGGDNPTPDQDIVDDIGKALGVQYEDNEELKGEKKISDRDKKRWELDPASSDDYEDR